MSNSINSQNMRKIEISDEVAAESIKNVADVFNKGIDGNPLAFVSVLIIIILSLLLIGVFGSNLYFQFENMKTQQDSTIMMMKNNELLQDIVTETKKNNDSLQKLLTIYDQDYQKYSRD